MKKWLRAISMALAVSLTASSCAGFAEPISAPMSVEIVEESAVTEQNGLPDETTAPEDTTEPAGSAGGEGEAAALTGIALSESALTLNVNENATLTVSANEGAELGEVTWTTSDETVATVAGGVVTAIGAGEATITAVCGELTASCAVTVKIPLTSITLNEGALTLNVNETATLSVSANEGAELGEVTWSSSDTAIATVENGVVTAIGAGEATITASCGGFTASCKVNVYVPLTQLFIEPEHSVLRVGDTLQLTLRANEGAVIPDAVANALVDGLIEEYGAADKFSDVRWTSSDATVATVSDAGLVTAVAPGVVKISAACGDIFAECTVDVRIPLQIGEHGGMVYAGETLQLSYSYNITEIEAIASAVWTVDDPAVAAIDAATGLLTGVSKGSVRATITVTGANGGVYTASTDVTVAVRLTGISLSADELNLDVGAQTMLRANLLPAGAEGDVLWASSDSAIAAVDQNGVVTAVCAGSTTITATCGAFIAVCRVNVTVPVAGVELFSDDMVLYPGQKGTIRYDVRPANASDKTISWISGDNSIATVSDSGVVTGVKAGQCVITGITSNDIAFSVQVRIVNKGQAVTAIKLNAASKALSRTQTFQLKATITPRGALDKSVTWASQNPAVATVDQNGKVTAVGVGSTTILAVASSGVYKTCRITVSPLKVTSVKLNVTKATLYNDQTLQLVSTLTPANADDLSVRWSSSKASVASVDENGLVTAHKAGSAYITCKSASGKTARCRITVKNFTPVLSATKLNIAAEETHQLSVAYKPATTQDMGLTWSSSRSSVATVDENGLITAVGKGTAKIYCRTKYGTADFVSVTVKAPSPVMNMTKKTIASGDSFQIAVTANPATDRDMGLTWASSRTSVATVDANGVVTGHKNGTAKITVRTKYGTTDTMTVTVKAVTPVMNVSKLSLAAEATYQVSVTYKPATAQDMGLTWYSSKTSVATVDANGLITAVGNGTAKVYCKTAYGKTDFVTVTVKAPAPVLNTAKKTLYSGTTYQLSVTGYSPATDKQIQLEWYSSKPSVATVDENGLVTAVKAGKAKIYCRTQYGTTDFVNLTVKATTPVMQGTAYTLEVGNAVTVPVTFKPDAAARPVLRWSTNNPRVATVNAEGLITAIGPGTATITVKTAEGKKDTCKISVSPLKVSQIHLSHPYGDMAAGGEYTISAVVLPNNAGNKALTWSSSNTAVATVNASGVVTAVSAGTAVITAAAKDGSGVTGSIDITVKAVTVTTFALDVESVQVTVGANHQVNMTLDAQLDTVSPYWSSDNPLVASVDQNGLITGVGSGITMVRCRIGGEVRSVKVIVPVVNGSYRVLIAGQYTDANVSGYLNFAVNGLQGVNNAFDLANVYGDRYQIARLNNPKKAALLSGIDSFFAGAGENDVSVLYLMSHGLNVGGEYRWMISDTNGRKYSDDDYVTEAELTAHVEQIGGKVLLVIVSCYSGQYLDNYCTEQAAASLSGVVSNVNGSRPGNQSINIITSQVGYINSPYTDFPTQVSYDFFNIVFNMALGWDQQNGTATGTLPADADGDGTVSMLELAQYLSANLPTVLQQHLNQYGHESVNNTLQQNVQYYLTTPNQSVYARARERMLSKLTPRK